MSIYRYKKVKLLLSLISLKTFIILFLNKLLTEQNKQIYYLEKPLHFFEGKQKYYIKKS